MNYLPPLALAALAAAACAAGPPAEKKEQPPGPAVVRLAKQAPVPRRALALRLTVDPLDEQDADAAQLWLRAGLAARSVRRGTTEEDRKREDLQHSPLDQLTEAQVKMVREDLGRYSAALALADRAALRTRCRW